MKTKQKPCPHCGTSSTAKNKPTLVAFMLDRTGSMASVKQETIGGFNGYLDELLKKDDGTMRFTLTQFDSIGVDVIHDAVPLKSVSRLTDKTYEPRANTPLYDALGKTIQATEASKDGHKVLFVVLTDGQENASSEWTDVSVKELIKSKEDKEHWTFAYIGVGIDGWAGIARLSSGTSGWSNQLKIDPKDIKRATRRAGGMTAAYACSVDAGIIGSAKNVWQSGLDDEDEK